MVEEEVKFKGYSRSRYVIRFTHIQLKKREEGTEIANEKKNYVNNDKAHNM